MIGFGISPSSFGSLQSTSPWAGDRCGAAHRTRSGVALLGGATPLSCGKRSEGKDRCGLQTGSGPVGAWWPFRSCPAAGVKRHHVHAMQLEQFDLGNNVYYMPSYAAEKRGVNHEL